MTTEDIKLLQNVEERIQQVNAQLIEFEQQNPRAVGPIANPS